MLKIYYKYLVVGAGPAGINAVAKLLESGVDSTTILWVDPDFSVGDFGTTWQGVPGNTKVSAYLPWFEMLKKVIEHTPTNGGGVTLKIYSDVLSTFEAFAAEYTCPLKDAAKPMYWATQHLKTVVDVKVGSVQQLKKCSGDWEIYFSDKTRCHAKCIIIATGAEAKKASLPAGVECAEISLAAASQEISSQQFYQEGKSVAVIGSSHSAALAVMQLLKSDHSVIWFKRNCAQALRYAEFHSDYTLYDNTGLKGEVAFYMKELEKQPNQNLTVVESNEENLRAYLINCSHVVHAIGFAPRSLPIVADDTEISSAEVRYDDRTGFADSRYPGLFFHGIGRPTVADELAGRGVINAEGEQEVLMAAAVGVGKFHKVLTAETIVRLEQLTL